MNKQFLFFGYFANFCAALLPFIRASNSFLSFSATSIRKRLFDSENNTKSFRSNSLPGTLPKSSSKPKPPANAISAAATANPPSERSWHDLTKPKSMALVTALNVRLAFAPLTFGTLAPKIAFELVVF